MLLHQSIAKGMIRKYYRISALKCENNTEIDSAQAQSTQNMQAYWFQRKYAQRCQYLLGLDDVNPSKLAVACKNCVNVYIWKQFRKKYKNHILRFRGLDSARRDGKNTKSKTSRSTEDVAQIFSPKRPQLNCHYEPNTLNSANIQFRNQPVGQMDHSNVMITHLNMPGISVLSTEENAKDVCS